jgi:hypothetical protein
LLGEDDLDARLARVARALAGHSAGKPLSQGMAQMTRTFDPATIEMTREGERSGRAADALELMAADSARSADLNPRLALAFIFPAIALGAAFLVLMICMTFVIPGFKDVFTGFGADLPAPTLFFLGLSDLVLSHWYLVFGIPIAVILAFALRSKYAYGRMLDRWLLSLPLVGAQLLRVHSVRMAGLLADAARLGIDARAALGYLRDTSSNRGLAERADVLAKEAGAAPSLAAWLAQSRSIPSRLRAAAGVQPDPQRLAVALSEATAQYAEVARVSAGRIERNTFILAYLLLLLRARRSRMPAQEQRQAAVLGLAPAAAPVQAALAGAVRPLEILLGGLPPGDALELLGGNRRALSVPAHDLPRRFSNEALTPVTRATSHRRSSGIVRHRAIAWRVTPMRRASSDSEPAALTALLRDRSRSMRPSQSPGGAQCRGPSGRALARRRHQLDLSCQLFDRVRHTGSRAPVLAQRYFAGSRRFWRAARYSVGEAPVQRRNARVNALCPEKPSRNVSSMTDLVASSM